MFRAASAHHQEGQLVLSFLPTGLPDSHPLECVIPDGVLIQVGPPDDEHLLLEKWRGVEINILRKSASSWSLTRITWPNLSPSRTAPYDELPYCYNSLVLYCDTPYVDTDLMSQVIFMPRKRAWKLCACLQWLFFSYLVHSWGNDQSCWPCNADDKKWPYTNERANLIRRDKNNMACWYFSANSGITRPVSWDVTGIS